MSADLHMNISAMKVALSFAHDGAVRARVLRNEERLAELDEVGRQLAKARILYAQVMREVRGPAALTLVKGGADK